MKDTINVYAESVDVNGEGDQVSVYLKNVDPEQVVKELNSEAVLDALEWSDIMDYVNENRGEDDE